MKYLIVNGDDFGASPGVNRGIAEAHARGILTSASLMVDGPAAVDACCLAREFPGLGIGLHAVLSNGAGDAELRRQVAGFVDLLGKHPTHLDSHHNVHLESPLAAIFLRIAREHHLPLRGQPPVRYVPDFYGQWDGKTHLEQVSVEALERIVGTLENGITELGCHPGYADPGLRSSYAREREAELRTLCDPHLRTALEREGVRLVNFDEVRRLR